MLKSILSFMGLRKPKYRATKEVREFEGNRHVQIVALRSWRLKSPFGNFDVREGDLGGFIVCRDGCEDRDLPFHLPHDDDSWVANGARLSGGTIKGNTWIGGKAVVIDCGWISDSVVKDNTCISNGAKLHNSFVGGNTKINGSSVITHSELIGDSFIQGRADLNACQLNGRVRIIDESISGAIIIGFAKFCGDVVIKFPKRNEPGQYYYPFNDMIVSGCNIQTEEDLQRSMYLGHIKKRSDGKTHQDAIERRFK